MRRQRPKTNDESCNSAMHSSATITVSLMAAIAYLECTKCGERLSGAEPQTLCPRDAGSLYVRYDLDAIKKSFTRQSLAGRPATMWRYADVLPAAEPVSLGEGLSPMLPLRRDPGGYIKEE